MLSRRGDWLRFVSVSSEILTGADGATNTARSWSMPEAIRRKVVTPAAWRITHRPLADVRRIGPGVGDQASPVSSSRTNSASPLGSVTGSFQNGVSRFSRLFSAQVNAEPEAETIVPNPGFAITFTHGSGVSRLPSRTTTYSFPSGVKPPN